MTKTKREDREMTVRVGKCIFSALRNLFRRQPNLSEFVPNDSDEREPNLSFHLANQLWRYFPWLDCDFDVIKPVEDNKRPDIIFHKRGSDEMNFLVVEVKRAANRKGIMGDIYKIQTHWFSDPLRYDFGASVVIDEESHAFEIYLLARYNPETVLGLTPHSFSEQLGLPRGASQLGIVRRLKTLANSVRHDAMADVPELKQKIYHLVARCYPLGSEEIRDTHISRGGEGATNCSPPPQRLRSLERPRFFSQKGPSRFANSSSRISTITRCYWPHRQQALLTVSDALNCD